MTVKISVRAQLELFEFIFCMQRRTLLFTHHFYSCLNQMSCIDKQNPFESLTQCSRLLHSSICHFVCNHNQLYSALEKYSDSFEYFVFRVLSPVFRVAPFFLLRRISPYIRTKTSTAYFMYLILLLYVFLLELILFRLATCE